MDEENRCYVLNSCAYAISPRVIRARHQGNDAAVHRTKSFRFEILYIQGLTDRIHIQRQWVTMFICQPRLTGEILRCLRYGRFLAV